MWGNAIEKMVDVLLWRSAFCDVTCIQIYVNIYIMHDCI